MYARKQKSACVISGLRHSVNEICAILEFYAAQNGNLVPTFRDNLSVPYSRVKHSFWAASPVKMGPISCSETLTHNYNSKVRKIPKQRKSQNRALHLQGYGCTYYVRKVARRNIALRDTGQRNHGIILKSSDR
jgi:hypothetical protein